MRRWIGVAIAAVLAVAIAAWWRTRDAVEDASATASVDEAAIAREKMRARTESGVDTSPSSATGRVTAAEGGAGIADALVLLTPKGMSDGVASTPGQRAVPLHARTDEGGQFRFTGVPGGRYTLSASAEGFLPARRLDVVLRPGADTEGLGLRLARGGQRVAGTIADVTGGPIEGALVRATRLDETSPLAFFSRAPSAAMSDAEGRYALWLPDGHYAMSASHADYVTTSERIAVDGGPRTQDFRLTPGAVIEGHVLSRADRSPVAGAHVRWTESGGGPKSGSGPFAPGGIESVVTGSDGAFRISGLSPGVVELSAVADHGATRQPVEVPLGVAEQVGDVEVLVDPAFKISGFVVSKGDESTGLEGVMLGAFSMRPQAFHLAAGPSERDGYFEILGVQPGTYNVGAFSEEALPKFLGETATVTDADVEGMLVVLERGAHVRGRVEPPVAASISVEVDAEEVGFFSMLSTIGNAFVRGRSGPDGTFDLFPVAPAKLTLVARADDGSEGRTPIDVGTDDLDDVVIELEPRAHVAGRVTDARGAPVEGVQVRFVALDGGAGAGAFSMNMMMGGPTSATSDEDGRYVVRGLQAGAHEVSVIAENGPALAWAEPADASAPSAPISIDVSDGEAREGFDLVVEARDGSISGAVVDEEGAPIADAWVRAYREQSSGDFFSQIRPLSRARDAEMVRAKERSRADGSTDDEPSSTWEMFAEPPVLTDETGRFEVTGLRDGTYTLVADAPRGEGRGRVARVAIGARAEIEVLSLGGLRGIVRSGGSPVGKYSLSVRGKVQRLRQIVDESGSYAVDRLDPGKYTVKVSADEGVAEAEVEIAEGETAELDLELEAYGTLRGRVVDAASGEGIAGLQVIGGRGGDGAEAFEALMGRGPQTDDDGRFELKKVRPGKGEVRFVDPDEAGFGAVAVAKYEIEGGEDEDLGTITGVKESDIPKDERGDLGLSTRVATKRDRPLAPDAPDPEPDTEPDASDPEPTDETEHLWVSAVTVGGAAQVAGVKPGDEIVSVRHVEVQSLGPAAASRSLSVAHVRAGEAVALELRREGSTLRVTLDARARKDE